MIQWPCVIIHLSKPTECQHQGWWGCVLEVHPREEMHFLGEMLAVGEAVHGGGAGGGGQQELYLSSLYLSLQYL